ncbi:MAG: hypothetical protein F6K41_11030 [Symploca sp. SIO3E6]|nr:hypothetical protein [Caldora sp. SIO3E6]
MKSLRAVARATNLSKSSVHRLRQRIKHRHQEPESDFWETPEGFEWLRLLVFATIYIFGIKQGVGSEVLSEFFHLLRLNKQVGVSPTALRRLETEMRSLIITYQEQQHQQIKQTCPSVEIIAGADETFFPGVPGIVLVLMDLVSGYIVLEKKTSDRKYQTWKLQVQTALSQIGIGSSIKSLVSDRALALIQLAVQGHGTQSIPDLFHAMRSISRYIGALLGGKLARTKRQLQQTSREITARQLKKKPISVRLSQRLSQLTEEYQFLVLGVESYRSVLHQISTIVHPFAIDGSGFQTGADIQDYLRSLLPSLAALGQTYQLNKIEKALEKFSCQINGIAAGINFWWQLVSSSQVLEELDAVTQNWLVAYLLPEVYWFAQFEKTKNQELRQLYQKAYEKAHQQLLAHSLTLSVSSLELSQWRDWATRMVAKFQRTTSAIEGRNGYLSRLHHSGRGLSPRDLQVLTVIHNFDLKRASGSTAASRFFGQDFPELFPWLISRMGDLPEPRKSRKSRKSREFTISIA